MTNVEQTFTEEPTSFTETPTESLPQTQSETQEPEETDPNVSAAARSAVAVILSGLLALPFAL